MSGAITSIALYASTAVQCPTLPHVTLELLSPSRNPKRPEVDFGAFIPRCGILMELVEPFRLSFAFPKVYEVSRRCPKSLDSVTFKRHFFIPEFMKFYVGLPPKNRTSRRLHVTVPKMLFHVSFFLLRARQFKVGHGRPILELY